MVKVAYDVLGLQTFYTSGPTETRAWTVKKGATAPEVYDIVVYNMALRNVPYPVHRFTKCSDVLS